LGKNIAIVWGSRTSLQAGGQRAGRQIFLTMEDARALERESTMIDVVSPEIQRGLNVKSAYNAASIGVTGIEPQYQAIRTLDIEHGRTFRFTDNEGALRVAILGADSAKQLFATRDAIGQRIELNGIPYTVIGTIRKKDQDSNYSGPDNDKVFVPFAAMAQDFPIPNAEEPGAVSNLIVAPQQWVVDDLPRQLNERTGLIRDIDWALQKDVRTTLARSKGFDADDKEAIWVWDTSVNSLMFGRMVDTMRDFFTTVGFITLALGGIGVMNIMLITVKERTREIGIRKALGATTTAVLRQFFLEGFFITIISGTIGLGIALGLCWAINLLPMPNRFVGMILSPEAAVMTIASLVVIGVATALYPARRAAELPPVDALRYEM
jgi:putative ABC transport system permease protein